MIRRHTIVFVAIIMVAINIFIAYPSRAETIVTDELIEKIKTNCTQNLASLNRLHQTDAFLRNDRGELYQTISNKLMVPLNQRLVENELDGSELITTTSDFNKAYGTFFQAYVEYDNTMDRLLKVNCSNEPVTFYTALEDAREQRSKLNKSDQRLKELIKSYSKQFSELRAQLKKEERI